ncbi:MAG: glutathione S-transferase N-terminal domain-containing protein [Eggerthellaceae bacterium]|nr:glutathione S-transferase N-terminal domain-containing protein [Eggerthellaceae bacterium]
MNGSLELYYYPECPYCQKVLRALDALGASDAVELRNIHADDDALQTLIAVGGKRQVPCLFIDGSPLYESGDIVEWLQGRFAS